MAPPRKKTPPEEGLEQEGRVEEGPAQERRRGPVPPAWEGLSRPARKAYLTNRPAKESILYQCSPRGKEP